MSRGHCSLRSFGPTQLALRMTRPVFVFCGGWLLQQSRQTFLSWLLRQSLPAAGVVATGLAPSLHLLE